jgi:hypothetical protein
LIRYERERAGRGSAMRRPGAFAAISDRGYRSSGGAAAGGMLDWT